MRAVLRMANLCVVQPIRIDKNVEFPTGVFTGGGGGTLYYTFSPFSIRRVWPVATGTARAEL